MNSELASLENAESFANRVQTIVLKKNIEFSIKTKNSKWTSNPSKLVSERD